MKKLLRIVLLLMIIIMVFCNVSCATNSNSKMSAYKQVSAFKLKLANGSTLVDTLARNDTMVTKGDIKIIFVLDNSASMNTPILNSNKSRLDVLKSSTKNLIQNIKNEFSSKSNVEIGFVNYNTDISGILDLTNIEEEETIDNFINEIEAERGTLMCGALKMAYRMLKNEDAAFKMIVTLSDGELLDEGDTLSVLKNGIHKDGNDIFTTSIFVGVETPRNFEDVMQEEIIANEHINIKTVDNDMESTIKNNLYKVIYNKIIEISEPTVELDVNEDYVGIMGNQIIMQMDPEILHGATLYIEYIISTTTAFDTNKITITDIPDKVFQFDENQKLLSENKTNRDYGWKYQDGKVFIEYQGNTNAGSEFKKKIVLSTVLTPEMLNNTSIYGNTANVSLQKNNGEIIQKNKLRAYEFLIIPPTGKYSKNIAIGVYITVLISTLILILVFIKLRHKHTKNK